MRIIFRTSQPHDNPPKNSYGHDYAKLHREYLDGQGDLRAQFRETLAALGLPEPLERTVTKKYDRLNKLIVGCDQPTAARIVAALPAECLPWIGFENR